MSQEVLLMFIKSTIKNLKLGIASCQVNFMLFNYYVGKLRVGISYSMLTTPTQGASKFGKSC